MVLDKLLLRWIMSEHTSIILFSGSSSVKKFITPSGGMMA